MKQSRILRAALLALATIFLAVAWAWDGFIAVGRLLVGLIPWARFKQGFVALVDWLPTPVVLLIFLVPLAIVEPLLTVAVVAMAMGYVISGAIAYILLKVLGFGLIAVIFDLTKHKLLTVRWFAWAYGKVVVFHDYADAMVAPYKRAAAQLMGQWRLRAASALAGLPGTELAANFFAARRRSANGRPRLPLKG
jgi:hypothetical protein